jgi:hypothetical protein
MKINHLLLEKKPVIIKKWFGLILETYPADTAKFLKSQNNRFGNPVGHTISEGISGLFEELLRDMDTDRISSYLDNIIKIRALQELNPSKALGFILVLKKVIREELANEIREQGLFEELMAFESKVDFLTNLSFDIYMQCREKLYALKAREARNLTSRILKRMSISEGPDASEERTAGL